MKRIFTLTVFGWLGCLSVLAQNMLSNNGPSDYYGYQGNVKITGTTVSGGIWNVTLENQTPFSFPAATFESVAAEYGVTLSDNELSGKTLDLIELLGKAYAQSRPDFDRNNLKNWTGSIVISRVAPTGFTANPISGSNEITLTFYKPADLLYVDGAVTQSGNGNDWSDAYKTIREAVDAGKMYDNMTEIRVASGTYPEKPEAVKMTTNIDGVNLSGFHLTGAFDPASNVQNFSTPTVIDVDKAGLDLSTQTGRIMLARNLSRDVTVQGFTFQNGEDRQIGGAVWINGFNTGRTFTFDHCNFKQNKVVQTNTDAMAAGGAIANESKLMIRYCHFEDNKVTASTTNYNLITSTGEPTPGQGGAIWNRGDDQQSNPYSLTIFNSTFYKNTANTGGAIFSFGNGSTNAYNTLFAGDVKVYGIVGGAIYMYGNSSTGKFVNCTFVQNQVTSNGGSFAAGSSTDLTVYNTIFWNNTGSTGVGNDFYLYGNSKLRVSYNRLNIKNIANQTPNEIDDQGKGLDASKSPKFRVDYLAPKPNFEDWYKLLLPCSFGVDGGNNAFYNGAEYGNTDRGNTPRIANGTIDLGAYEAPGIDYVLPQSPNTTLAYDNTESICNGWIHYFNEADKKIIASINPNGQNLGTVTAQNKLNDQYGTGSVTTLNSPFGTSSYFYPFNRSWSISATNSLTVPVNVRIYFSDTDVSDITSHYSLSSLQNLLLYKVDGDNAYDPAAGNYTELTYGSAPSTSQYTLGTMNGYRYAEFQVSSFSSGTMALKSEIPLPLTLLSFKATAVENTVRLNWLTADEYAVNRIEIQKSRNAKSWQLWKAVLPGLQKTNKYESFDIEPFDGLNYYRLKMIDNDGSYSYSRAAVATIMNENKGTIQLYPNPNNGSFTVKMEGFNQKTGVIQISDMLGRPVATKPIHEGSNELNLNSLTTGIYILKTQNLNKMTSQKLVIIR